MSSPQHPTQHGLVSQCGRLWGHIPSGWSHWPPPGHASPSDSIGKARAELLVLLSRAVATHKRPVTLHWPHHRAFLAVPNSPAGKGEP